MGGKNIKCCSSGQARIFTSSGIIGTCMLEQMFLIHECDAFKLFIEVL